MTEEEQKELEELRIQVSKHNLERDTLYMRQSIAIQSMQQGSKLFLLSDLTALAKWAETGKE